MTSPSSTPKLLSRLFHHLRALKTHISCLGWLHGLSAWLRSSIFKHEFVINLPSPTGTGSVQLRAGTSDMEVYKKVFVQAEYEPPFTPSANNILDLGANIGLSALYFHVRYPSATILAVEPNADNFSLLQKNTAGIPNIIPLQAAVWTHDGMINLCDPGIGAWGFQVTDQPLQDSTSLVPAVSIPTLLKRFPGSCCHLMKVDIEGAEKELFYQSQDWIDHVDAVVIELHDRFKPGCSRAFFGATSSFPCEYWKGENIFVWKVDCTNVNPTPTPQ
jgi:FkbM family methyltransferase